MKNIPTGGPSGNQTFLGAGSLRTVWLPKGISLGKCFPDNTAAFPLCVPNSCYRNLLVVHKPTNMRFVVLLFICLFMLSLPNQAVSSWTCQLWKREGKYMFVCLFICSIPARTVVDGTCQWCSCPGCRQPQTPEVNHYFLLCFTRLSLSLHLCCDPYVLHVTTKHKINLGNRDEEKVGTIGNRQGRAFTIVPTLGGPWSCRSVYI